MFNKMIAQIAHDTTVLAIKDAEENNELLDYETCYREYAEQLIENEYDNYIRVWLGYMIEKGSKEAIKIMKSLIIFNLMKSRGYYK